MDEFAQTVTAQCFASNCRTDFLSLGVAFVQKRLEPQLLANQVRYISWQLRQGSCRDSAHQYGSVLVIRHLELGDQTARLS